MDKIVYFCKDIRCKNCNKKLAEWRIKKQSHEINIKCPKCGYINKL